MKTTVNDDSLKNSLGISAGLHLCLMLFLYFGLPHIFTPLPSHHDPVPFEIVEIADITNTSIKPEEPKTAAAPPPVPAPKTQSQPPTPAQPKVVEKVEAIALPKPAEKPKPPQDVKPKDDMFSKMLKDVSKLKPQEETKPTEVKTADAKQPAQEQKSMAPTLSSRLTITEEDALRRQIGTCWNMPIGAKDAQNLIVEIAIDVNPDRTVQNVQIVDQSRYATDTFYRAAADAAVRAVRNPKCSPLELPADKYDEWKHIDFTFDPRDML
jgi:outer membrane biosynthesis protein TonB